ncbi:RNI-like protein [Pholiota conissans]|uniref:RNI-like protein n=1 Tax=Pholiota conissans TaxID=109636 RepID=A0A9P5Z0G3_9AGAR|nr:RNI-like protein [Pholiota conissans]
MASSSSSSSSSTCPPSSSAVTIPVPGKSILKKPPPAQQSLFSRITRFLPTQTQPQSAADVEDAKPLKRAHFILPEIAIVYPIMSGNPPSTPTLKEEKKAIEDKEVERRKKVLRGNANSPGGLQNNEWWSMDKVESFYRECCAGCEEEPDPAITVALKHASPTSPRTVDFSGVQLTFTSASILSDVFSIEWGLRKLVFRECDLDDHILKPMLHALLIPGTLSFLSVASNRRLKTAAFRLIGAYVKKAKTLQFLDLSQNLLDKKSVEYIVAALETAPEPGLVSLRLDDCALRPAALETLCRAVRTSSLKNISLRHNRISASGGVALALMIRDYPDVVPGPMSPISSSLLDTPNSSRASSPTSSLSNLPPLVNSPPSTPITGVNAPPLPPPPRHPTMNLQTTYTPYVPRARRGRAVPPAMNPLSPTGQHIPIITSSSQGGVTTRHPTPNASALNGHGVHHDAGPSAALLDKVRALDSLPRLGALRTLDLKGNDLRTGITYLAQVLKRNRTLKVLNLSENKLDVQCLVIIAEALKYNSSLETLDLNKNPCSGPGLEGIQSLRTAFTLNTALKRLFLSSTSMTSAGAIALAEFLPESTSLLHLDLTMNELDIAGVMALSSGLKANHVMRCLDLNIPPGDEEFARMCREILNTCVRNTEEAERATKANAEGASVSSGRGLGKGVWGMIEESELAKSIRLGEEKKNETDVVVRAWTYVTQLSNIVAPEKGKVSNPTMATHESLPELTAKSKAIASELALVIQETEDPSRLEELLGINDQLLSLLKKVPAGGKPNLRLQGLGLAYSSSQSSSEDGDGRLDGLPNINGRTNALEADSEDNSITNFDDEDVTPTTPKIDKGKRRAEPEPEEPEMVLSPNISKMNGGSEDDGVLYLENVASPTDRSRIWVEEEGEVFRKGTVLLGPEEMEGEYAGEELRKELLEAMVERPPPRPLTDEYGLEIVGMSEPERERSPSIPSAASPTGDSPKVLPKPYISRRSSNNSILSLLSPTIPTPATESGTQSPASMSSPRIGAHFSPNPTSSYSSADGRPPPIVES